MRSLLVLEELSSLHFEVECHVVLEVTDPLLVAAEELAVLLLVGGDGVEGCASVAFLVTLEVLGHMVTHETFKQVQLEIVLLIELLALDCLSV